MTTATRRRIARNRSAHNALRRVVRLSGYNMPLFKPEFRGGARRRYPTKYRDPRWELWTKVGRD